MNKFKDFLKERWIKSGKTAWGPVIKIFINPTGKELKETTTDIRGFAAPNGNAYVGSNSIHPDIADVIAGEVLIKYCVPFIIVNKKYSNKSKTKSPDIEFGDHIHSTKYNHDFEGAKRMLEDNMWIKKMFPNANITGEIY